MVYVWSNSILSCHDPCSAKNHKVIAHCFCGVLFNSPLALHVVGIRERPLEMGVRK